MDVTKEQLMAAFGRVPRPIREFLSDSELGPIGTALAEKYKLHIDAAGTLVDIITKTLLGFIRPEELPPLLMERLLLEQTMANTLIGDINSMVFVPLQKKVRDASAIEEEERALEQELAASAPEEPAIPEVTTAPTPASPPKPAPLPPPAIEYAPVTSQTLPGSPVPVPIHAPVTSLNVVPESDPFLPVPFHDATPQYTTPQQHAVHAMPTATHQPGWHPAAAVHIFVPTGGYPVQGAPQQPVVEQGTVPAAQPVQATPPAPVYTAPATQAPTYTAQNPIPPTAPENPIERSYAADPYREPV